MNYTKNLNLKKPGENDYYDIDNHNDNYDAIDAAIGKIKAITDNIESDIPEIKAINKEVVSIGETVKRIKEEITEINANAELIEARGNEKFLGNRLDKFDEQLDTNTKELNSKIDEVANTGTTAEVIKNKVSEMAKQGLIQAYTLGKGTVTEEKTNFILKNVIKSKQLFNKNTCHLNVGFNDGAGIVSTSKDGYFINDFIKLEQGKKYIISGMTDLGFPSTMLAFEVNSDKTIGNLIGNLKNNSIFTASQDGYLRFQCLNRELNTLMINEGDTALPYENYFESIEIILREDIKVLSSEKKIKEISSELDNIKNAIKNTDKPTSKTLTKLKIYDDKIENYTTKTSSWNTSLITSPNTFYAKEQKNGGKFFAYFRYNIAMEQVDATFPKYQTVHGATTSSEFVVEFMTDCEKLEVLFRSTSNRIQIIADRSIIFNDVLKADRTLIEFENKKIRHIKILCQQNSQFGGVAVDTRSTIWKCNDIRKKIAIDGDSIAWGATNEGQALNSPVGIISQVFDWDFFNNAIGGTGYVSTSNGSSIIIKDRLQNLIKENPDVILILNGLNDCSPTFLASLKNNVDEYFKLLKTHFSTKDIIICSPFNPQATLEGVPYLIDVEKIIREKALEYRFPYIDLLRGNTYNSKGELITSNQGGIITGTGTINNVQATGNRSIYISDGTHLTPDGGKYLGFRIMEEVYKILSIL